MANWLSGMKITAARLKVDSAQNEDTTSRTTSSNTYTDASGGAMTAAVIVPMSGKVAVEVRSTQRNNTAATNTITSWNGVGSVSGAVYSNNDTAALIVTGTGNMPLDLRYHLSGLVPGETLTVTIKHRVNNAASVGTFDYRQIMLEGLP